MEIILKQDIPKLGNKNDIIKVKNGYGRNYLIPQKLAVLAIESVKKITQENLKQSSHKTKKIKDEALHIAQMLKDVNLIISVKAGDNGKIYGSITNSQIAEELHKKGIQIDRKKILLKEHIKQVGEFSAIIDLHKEIKPEITINVIPE
ncbi:MAG: 50S ribosomal protein L9 [Chitinophagaceae bacterium]|nr:50S ribosomal protein L9 [Chitinophagaceae bacterium]